VPFYLSVEQEWKQSKQDFGVWQANPDSAAAWTWKQVTNMLNPVIGRIGFYNRQILCAKELRK
jgi:hypothetical protein